MQSYWCGDKDADDAELTREADDGRGTDEEAEAEARKLHAKVASTYRCVRPPKARARVRKYIAAAHRRGPARLGNGRRTITFDSRIYAALGPRDGWDAVDLMACINGAIECSRQLLDYESALLWVEEAETLDKYLEAEARASSFEWVQIQSASSDYYYFERLTTLCLASQVFFALGNTASAVYRLWLADELLYAMPRNLKTPQILKLAPLLGIDILSLRHPDPESAAALSIDHARLQLRGSWKKAPYPLIQHAGFSHALCDVRVRRLPDGPTWRWAHIVFLGWPAAIAVFDTTQCTWEMMKTTFVHDAHMHTWPYHDWRVTEYTAQCVGDRLYIFGGIHGRERDRHGPSNGAPHPQPQVAAPKRIRGPQALCVEPWAAGNAATAGWSDRPTTEHIQQAHYGPPFYSHAYADLWSWNINAEQWRRERLCGNVPSSRSEMACTYNPILDKVIVFGGYSPKVPTWLEDLDDIVTYSYYADTFIADAGADGSPGPWKQILTRGFPTYRAQSALVTDTRTGKIFLFSGYKNNVYVPSRNRAPDSSARSFNDLWQLRLDFPGGFFDGVNLEEEARTAQVAAFAARVIERVTLSLVKAAASPAAKTGMDMDRISRASLE
ncbi:hypothetical protein B0H14DRAFT_3884360 [Mycena olivaceomarginata]|nr:hypothetical protein B0H14DRAFT_3884360 [Mycena olivaceomarginata]